MRNFEYVRVGTIAEAITELVRHPTAQIIAGGTNLVDLMKYHVARPARLIDITRLPLDRIEPTASGGLRIGALVSNAGVAASRDVQTRYPLLVRAIMAGASGQLRNAATTGGNLLQRTRCVYFYDIHTPCNKREPGTGCPAIAGYNRQHAILGASTQCVAVHPSDMCVALAALDAVIVVMGPDGERSIALADFHRLPGDRADIDTTLERKEVVIAVELPAPIGSRYSYVKVRDRLSYAFALISVAAHMNIREGVIQHAAVAVGGVAHKPWRVLEAEAYLVGQTPESSTYSDFAERVLQGAVPLEHNAFKIELARRTIVRALREAASDTDSTPSVNDGH